MNVYINDLYNFEVLSLGRNVHNGFRQGIGEYPPLFA
jgi:hypothetical protein